MCKVKKIITGLYNITLLLGLKPYLQHFRYQRVYFWGPPQGPIRVNEGQVSSSGQLTNPYDHFYAEYKYMGLKKNSFGE